jgi:hypothetical protein
MVEAFFGFKKTPFSDSPDAKQLFASQAWNQVKARLQFLVDHHGAGLLTGEVGAGKSTAARTFSVGRLVATRFAAARYFARGADCGALYAQIHRPRRDRPCLPQLFGCTRSATAHLLTVSISHCF